MPSRTYIVNYDITANTNGAISEFAKLEHPMKQVAEQARIARESFSQIVETARELKSVCNNFVVKPIIDTKSFADSLATMEANVKASSTRMRASLESALSGSLADNKRINNLLGANNWKKAESEQEDAIRRLESRLKLLNNVKSKFSTGKSENAESARKAANEYFTGLRNAGIDGLQRASDLFNSEGIGNILYKNDNGWKLAKGDALSKINDYTKSVKNELDNARNILANAQAKNAKEFGKVAEQTTFSKRGNFIERALGISPEALKEMNPMLNAIKSLTGGTTIQDVVKKIPIPKPLKPSDLPSLKEIKDMKQEVSDLLSSKDKFPRESEIKGLEKIVGTGHSISRDKKNLDSLKAQKEIWQNSLQESIENKNKQIHAMQSQRTAYTKELNEWKKKPYNEVIEKVAVESSAVSKPIVVNIEGNFKEQIKPLGEVSTALNAIPKAGIDIPVNIKLPTNIVASLNTIRTGLEDIQKLKTTALKGGLDSIKKAASETQKVVDNTKKKATEKITTKATIDTSAINSEFGAAINSIKKIASENSIVVKVGVDSSSAISSFKASMEELKNVAAKNKSITIKTDIKTSGNYKKLNESIKSLKNRVNKANISLKVKYDGVGLNGKLRETIKSLNEITKKNFVTIKSKFDTNTIKKDLESTLKGLSKTTLKDSPTIKVNLDITEAKAQLEKLLTSIKAASPQTIKLGATNSSVKNTATTPKQAVQAATSNRAYSNASGYARGTAGGRTPIGSSKPGIVDRLRKSMYPLTGNVSLGASTPVALDMAKGMGIMYGVGGAMNLVTGGLTDAMEYQNTMETAEEILRKNYRGKNFSQDFNSMAAEVRRVAKQTKFTAPQSAEATRFMAMAGLSIPQIKSAVSPIADVAVIGDNDFGEVADKFTNIQTAFGIKPKNMRHMADAVTNTFTKTNTDMMMLAESMQYAAPMAHLAGESIENTLAMIGVMGNSGIQASMAGTTLRMMMQNTLNPNKKQSALWKQLGVKTRDKDGSLRDMIDILADVKEAAGRKNLPMADVVSNLFRVTASAGAGALITNIEKVKELAEQNKSVGNISSEISERKQNTVKGMWAQMTSAFTEANLRVFEQFQGDIIEMIKSVRDYFSSREAIENLRSAFELIKDLINAFGWVAKKWLGLYNSIGDFMKIVVMLQFGVAQIGFLIKPIMSLINVFGGLKNMAVGFVGALSSFGTMKKATVAASMIGALSPNPAVAINQGVSTRAAFAASYSEYKKNMDKYMLKQATYDFIAYHHSKRNELERSRNLINRRPLNVAMPQPHRTSLSTMSRANKAILFGDLAYTASALRGTNGKPLYFDKKYTSLTANSIIGTGLAQKFSNSKLKAIEKSKKIELEIENFKKENESRLKLLREAKQAEQLKNASGLTLYRASRIAGHGRWHSLASTLGGGYNAAYTALSFKSISTGLFASLKSGFLSILSGTGKVFGALTSPIGLLTIAVGSATTAIFHYASVHSENARKLESNTKHITDIISRIPYPGDNYKNQMPKTKYFDIKDSEAIKAQKKRNLAYNIAWDDRVFKNGGVKPWKIANAWSDRLEDNAYLFGNDYKYFNRETLKDVATKDKRELSDKGVFAARLAGVSRFGITGGYGSNDGAMEIRDMKELQKKQQLSSLYLEGASSKKTLQIQNSIISLKKQLLDKKISQNEWDAQINKILSINKLTENDVNKIPRFIGDPNNLKNVRDWSKYQQYWIGMRQQVLEEIKGGVNTISGYYEGINQLRSGVKTYSSQWWNAIRHIIGGMQTTVDSAGHAVQIKFDPTTGQVQWKNVINQIRRFNKNFKDTMYEYLKLMGQAYGAMVDNGLVGNYFKDWRKFYIEQNKHRHISENDARFYYSHFDGYSGDALENVVKNGQWRDNTNEGYKRRKIIRERLATMQADEAKRAHDANMKSIKNQQKAFQNSVNSSNSSGGSYTSPIADAAKDTNKGLGGNNRGGGVNARPTQINISVDKLANFDKIQFLEGDKQAMMTMIANAVAEAFGNVSIMASSLASNDKRDVYMS